MRIQDRGRAQIRARTQAFGALTCAAFMTIPVLAQPHPAQAVMDADRAFAARAMQVGPGRAFADFAESHVLMLNDPTPGSRAGDLATLFAPDLVIEWAPVDGAIADDGSLGYTWGKARYFKTLDNGTRQELPPSRYVTIWRKQADGSWKFLADGGLHAPEAKAFLENQKAGAP